jgi:hypothetical protein
VRLCANVRGRFRIISVTDVKDVSQCGLVAIYSTQVSIYLKSGSSLSVLMEDVHGLVGNPGQNIAVWSGVEVE